MTLSTLRVSVFIQLSLLTFIGISCSPQMSAPPSLLKSVSIHEPLRVSRSPWVPWELITLAEKNGTFAKNQLALKIHYFTEMHDSRRAFEKRNVDIALLTPYEVLLSKDAGADPVIIFTTDTSYGADALVVQKEIQSIADLKGKTVGVEIGTISHFTLLSALKRAKLAMKDVTILNIGNNDIPDAFREKRIHAAATWEPYVSPMLRNSQGKILFDSREMKVPPRSVVVIHRDVYEKRKEDVLRFRQVWFDIAQDFNAHPEETLKGIAAILGDRVENVKTQWKGILLARKEQNLKFFNPEVSLPEFKELETFLIKEGLIRKRTNLESLIIQEPLIQERGITGR